MLSTEITPSVASGPTAAINSGLAAQPGITQVIGSPPWYHSRRITVVSARYEPVTITSGFAARTLFSSDW